MVDLNRTPSGTYRYADSDVWESSLLSCSSTTGLPYSHDRRAAVATSNARLRPTILQRRNLHSQSPAGAARGLSTQYSPHLLTDF